MSGAFGVTRVTEQEAAASRWATLMKVFGPVDSETRKANDLFLVINDIQPGRIASLPFFYFDCGTEDAPNIFNYNRQLAGLMSEKKIPHEYRELPGDHSWGYWDRQVQAVLKIASQKMAVLQLAAP
jgi:putative tributyrin esterase